MPIKLVLFGVFILSISCNSEGADDIDTESVNWLLSQISIGEAQQNKQLVDDSLAKLLAIAPNRIETKCALGRHYFMNNDSDKALQLLGKINSAESHSCIEQLKAFAKVVGVERAQIRQARLLAKAGQYKKASTLYDKLFPRAYPALSYELEHLNWLAQQQTNWQQVNRAYLRLINSYPNIGRVEVAFARHLLRQSPTNKQALTLLKKYGTYSRFSNEVEQIWLSALNNMPINKQADKQFQAYFGVYPFSSRGKTQYQDFKKALQTRENLLADPAYQLALKGNKLLEKEQPNAAITVLLKALKGRPKDSAILRSLGLGYLQTGQNKLAYNYFFRAQQHAIDFSERETLKGLATTAKFWLYISEVKQAISQAEFKTALLKLNLADALNEDPVTILFHKGNLLFAQGQFAQAQRVYNQVLTQQPLNSGALNGLLEITELDKNDKSLSAFYNRLSNSQKQLIQASYSRRLSNNLRDKATHAVEQGQIDEAEAILKNAIELTPQQAWLYYDLALIYQQKDELKKAHSLYNKVLWQYPLNPQLRYSHALFLRAVDDYQAAINTLSYIPIKERDADIAALEQQLRMNQSLLQSERYLNAENKVTSIYHLSSIEAQPLTPILQAKLASNWYAIDEQRRALSLLNRALIADPSLAPYWHILYGEWLLGQNNRSAITQWFNDYTLPTSASEQQINQYTQLKLSYLSKYYNDAELIAKLNQLDQSTKNNPSVTTALIAANVALGQNQAAAVLYQQKVKKQQTIEPQGLIAMAQAYRQLGDDFQAKQVTLKAIEQTPSEQTYLQRQIMSSLNDFNYAGDALFLAKTLISKSPNDKELRYLGAEVAEQFNQGEQATTWYKQTLFTNQDISDEYLYKSLADINSEDPWYINNAKRALISRKGQNQGYIAIGVNFSGQTSTQNDSTLAAGTVPIEAYFPLWQGQGFVKIDPTSISAQTTRFDEQFAGSRYGQGALCIFSCPENQVSPKQRGIDVGIGWQNENWRFDIGTTPLGFLIKDMVWGVNYKNSLGDIGYSLELEKRPVTSSVLSYAGLKDIKTGEIWGGVRSTGLTFNTSYDLGGDWGLWSSADYQLYKGQNVKDNSRYRVMGGAYYRVISNLDREFSVGTSLLHWSYESNLSEQTWGHGGYYSPQNYVGLSVPLTYDARWGNDFVYRVKTGVSFSQTVTQSIDFFPNDENLQLAAYNREPITGVDPVYQGDTSSGISYNLEGSFEYRVTPHWFFGGYLAIDRADFYEPNFGQLYIRYYFNPVYGILEFPGTPIIPYADF